jgi:Mg2+ and Co2+ transporter CorA
MLMDSTTRADVLDPSNSRVRISQKTYLDKYYDTSTTPLYSPYLPIPRPQTFSSVPSMVEKVVVALLRPQNDCSTASCFNIIEIVQHPIELIIAEWTIYSLLMGRYVQLYEFSFDEIQQRSSTDISDVILDIHRWRRRSQRSLEKLQALNTFIDKQLDQTKTSKRFTENIELVSNRIVQYRTALESTVPTIMSMIQLMDSRRATVEAVYVKRLTYIALFFLPLSFVASLFSMSESFAVNTSGFKTYLATAFPLLVLVLLISNLGMFQHKLLSLWKKLQGPVS